MVEGRKWNKIKTLYNEINENLCIDPCQGCHEPEIWLIQLLAPVGKQAVERVWSTKLAWDKYPLLHSWKMSRIPQPPQNIQNSSSWAIHSSLFTIWPPLPSTSLSFSIHLTPKEGTWLFHSGFLNHYSHSLGCFSPTQPADKLLLIQWGPLCEHLPWPFSFTCSSLHTYIYWGPHPRAL